jgi:hypothetical protein
MRSLTEQIERALDAKLYFLAIFVSVATPDICAALEQTDAKTSPERYKIWFDKWLAHKFAIMNAEQMYCLRCGIVHQGRAKHTGLGDKPTHPWQYDRVLFTWPGGGPSGFGPNITMENCKTASVYTGEKVAVQDAEAFCRAIIAGVEAWYASTKNDSTVQGNLKELFRERPEGYPGIFHNIACIG